MDLVASLGIVTLFGCGLGGYGHLLLRLAGEDRHPLAPLSLAVGIAAWSALGGVLVLAAIARGLVLDGAMLAGCAVTIWAAWRRRERLAAPSLAAIAAWLPVVAIFVFLLVTLVPSDNFSERDDLRKYLGHLARLLQTGTVAGSPINSTGSETLGAQTFLQAWPVAHLSIFHVYLVDSVFCLTVLMGLAASRAPKVAALAAMLAVVAIHPMAFNITAIYSVAAVVCALSLVIAGQRPERPMWRQGVIPGAVYAFLLAAKPIFLVFVLAHAVAAAILMGVARRRGGDGLRWLLSAALWGTVLAAPWALVHAANYLAALRGDLPDLAAEGLQFIDDPLAANPPLDLLSMARLSIGGSYGDFTVTALILLALAVCAVVLCVRRPAPAARGPAVALAAAGVAVAVGVFLMLPLAAPLMSGPEHTMRFLAPTLIGGGVAILILLGDVVPGWRGEALAAGVAVVVIGLFWPTIGERAQFAWRYHTIRTFPHATEPFLLDYIHDSVGDRRRDQMATLQALVPAGEPIIAWVASPYFLDFKRNPIVDVEHSGTAMPWAARAFVKMPRYVIWQHQGMVMESFDYLKRAARASWAYAYDRRFYRAAAAFGTRLALQVRTGEVIGSLRDKDEAWVVVRLPQAE